MSAIRREKPSYGILWSEINLIGQANEGIGRFVTKIQPQALSASPLVATVAYAGPVSVGIGVHPLENEVIVLLGSDLHHSRKVYRLPNLSADDGDGHQLEIVFNRGTITSVLMDGMQLAEDIEPQA